MDALNLLAYQTERQQENFFAAFKSLPADKLDWAPHEGARSALDQLQEVAKIAQFFPNVAKNRKLEFTTEQFEQYEADRKSISDPAELERMTREATKHLIDSLKDFKAEELMDNVEMPWPGEYRVADVLNMHAWNMAYHEGQIYYIASQLK